MVDKKVMRKIVGLSEKYSVPSDLIDIEALYDDTLEFSENYNMFEEIIKGLSEFETKVKVEGTKKSIKSEKEERDRVELENLKKETEVSEKEFEEALNKIKFKTTDILE